MTIETFWDMIEKSRCDADGDCDQIALDLTARLEKLEPTEIISFHDHLWECLSRADRSNILAVAYIIHGGCSDDAFTYFRGWLVTQGRTFFEQVLAKPETAADGVREDGNDEEVECEAILYVAWQAYQNQTGEEIPQDEAPDESSEEGDWGEAWQEEDLEKMYPELCKRFWSHE